MFLNLNLAKRIYDWPENNSPVAMKQATPHLQCLNCGFDADAGDDWEAVEDVTLGTLTRCPECDSTNVQHKR